jgi:hypothetical protein
VSQKTEHDPAGSSGSNPFDPAPLRLDQNFAEINRVKKLLTTVPVRKPNQQDFVRMPLIEINVSKYAELRGAAEQNSINEERKEQRKAADFREPAAAR